MPLPIVGAISFILQCNFVHLQAKSFIKMESEKLSTLRTEGLVKRYGERTVANEVSISVRQGEIVGLLDPNGAGNISRIPA